MPSGTHWRNFISASQKVSMTSNSLIIGELCVHVPFSVLEPGLTRTCASPAHAATVSVSSFHAIPLGASLDFLFVLSDDVFHCGCIIFYPMTVINPSYCDYKQYYNDRHKSVISQVCEWKRTLRGEEVA